MTSDSPPLVPARLTAEERARTIMAQYDLYPGERVLLETTIASAIREAEDAAYRRAAEIAEDYQSVSGASDAIAKAIRALSKQD